MSAAATVRPLAAADRAEWAALWEGYLTFYGTAVGPEVYDAYFARLLGDDPQDYHGLVAEGTNGRLLGLTHYLFHRHGWRIENVVYLQDLFVAPEARGTGAGRALIEAVYAAADAAGCPSVYWLTQTDNATARRLYDRLATPTDFMKYAR
ncbi:MAG: GNAT family N-acetyltransferase [Pseudomonadota bacterium]